MPTNQEIHSFAEKWFDLFRNAKTTACEVEGPSFTDECSALGFQMDCGAAFEKAYSGSKAFHDYKALEQIIDGVTDIALLGSAIFSKWHY